MAPRKLHLALAGLGRIGKKHAINILNQSMTINFVAALAPLPEERQWGEEHLAPHGVSIYSRYEDMMAHPGLQAVLIATAAAVHEEEIMQALGQNLHVLCEMPLSTNVEAVCFILENSHGPFADQMSI